VHNTYFTLPVLFAMMSNHYSMTYTHAHNWLVLVLIMTAGVLIRQFFVLRHKGVVNWKLPVAAVAVLTGVAIWIAPTPAPVQVSSGPAPVLADVLPIIEQRCVMCHNAQLASKNVRLDSPESVQKQAALIHQQTVVSRIMPMNNATGITEAERATLARWFEAGAR
jgi:uncharacterized membrane protein